ncbi:hypothetical protein BX600DRAFT_535950 [Xylariales sp. PMI_506]|nr:hypothetical protein BX600DRAFT_535950 [Xylariales sp. PMI_506]
MKRPFRLSWPALLSLLATRPFVNGQCSDADPCTEGCCSSISGVCGYGPDYCGASACIAAASTNGSCAQLAECDPGGTTSDFCGTETVVQPSCSGTSASSGRSIAYYEGWNLQRPCDTMLPEDIPVDAYTHIYFSFLYIDPNTYELTPMASNQTDLYAATTALKANAADLEVWISIGGWSFTDPGATQETFTTLAASDDLQEIFFESVIDFLEEYGFDGVDIDWEYPGAPDRGGQSVDVANYPVFLSKLKARLGDGYGLSITIPASYWYLQWFDIIGLSGVVDWFNMMTYDMHGVWDATDVYVGSVINPHTNLTEIQEAMDLLWRNDIDPSMVNMGLGFYGRSFTLLDDSCITPGVCNFTVGGEPGACTQTSGILSFDEIEALLADPSNGAVMTLYEDAAVQVVTWDENQWVSFDNNVTFQMKMDWANSVCLGGTMVWAVDLDTTGLAITALRNTTNITSADDGSGEGAGDVYVGPDLWTNATQSIGCSPPCTFVLPPYQLGSTTTISWPAITTSLAVSAGGSTSTLTTTIVVEPFVLTAIPWWAVTVVDADPTLATFTPEQSIAPPAFTIDLPGSINTFPIVSTDYTALAETPTSTAGAPTSSMATPSPVQTGIVSGCTEFYEAVVGDSCDGIAANYGISLDQFYDWNPAVGQCTDLEAGVYYCVSITGGSTSTRVSTPIAVQTGITSNCIKFYFSVTGDSCDSVASAFDITEAEFIQWNPAVGSECTNFWLSEYYCVEVSTTSTVKSTTKPATFYTSSHKITISPQPTVTKVTPSKSPVPITYTKGKRPDTGGCSEAEHLLGLCGTHDCSYFGCSGACGSLGCDGGCGLGFCGGGCGLGDCGPGCGDGACVTSGEIGDGENDDCSELVTATVCTEIITSFTTTGTWSTETKTHCEITEGCSVVGSTVTTTETTSGVYGTLTASLWDYVFATPNAAELSSGSSSVRSEQSAMDATRWGGATSTPVCNIEEDPDAGIGAYCICSGYPSTLSTIAGTSPCHYTVLPTVTTKAATTPARYTYSDPYGDVYLCSSSSVELVGGFTATLCEGTISTIITGTPPTASPECSIQTQDASTYCLCEGQYTFSTLTGTLPCDITITGTVTVTPTAAPTPTAQLSIFLQEEEDFDLDSGPDTYDFSWVAFAEDYGDAANYCGTPLTSVEMGSVNPDTLYPSVPLGYFDISKFGLTNCVYDSDGGDGIGLFFCDQLSVANTVCKSTTNNPTDKCPGFPTSWVLYPSIICSWY